MDLKGRLQKLTDYHKGISGKYELFIDDEMIEGMDFTEYDVSYSRLTNIKFMACDFSGVAMDSTCLFGSEFTSCVLNGNSFIKTDASETVFSKLNFKNAKFFRADLMKTEFKSISISNSVLKFCNIEDTMENVVFKETDLTGTGFDFSEFKAVWFEDCLFDKTTFRYVKGWENVNFKNSKILVEGETYYYEGNEIKSFIVENTANVNYKPCIYGW